MSLIVLAICVSLGTAVIIMIALVCLLVWRARTNKLIPGTDEAAAGGGVVKVVGVPMETPLPGPRGPDRGQSSGAVAEAAAAQGGHASGLLGTPRSGSFAAAGPSSPLRASLERPRADAEIPKRSGAVLEHLVGSSRLTRGEQLKQLAWETTQEEEDFDESFDALAERTGTSPGSAKGVTRREALLRLASADADGDDSPMGGDHNDHDGSESEMSLENLPSTYSPGMGSRPGRSSQFR